MWGACVISTLEPVWNVVSFVGLVPLGFHLANTSWNALVSGFIPLPLFASLLLIEISGKVLWEYRWAVLVESELSCFFAAPAIGVICVYVFHASDKPVWLVVGMLASSACGVYNDAVF
jgi:hypothetical protein